MSNETKTETTDLPQTELERMQLEINRLALAVLKLGREVDADEYCSFEREIRDMLSGEHDENATHESFDYGEYPENIGETRVKLQHFHMSQTRVQNMVRRVLDENRKLVRRVTNLESEVRMLKQIRRS